MGIRIISTGAYLPTSVESIQPHPSSENNDRDSFTALFSGAQEHRVCQDHETPTYMGIQAARDALRNADIDPQTIDTVLCYSGIEDNETPKDVYGMLSEIGCDGAVAWTIDTACASFLSHLNCANALAMSGKQRLLIINSMNWVNRAFSKKKGIDDPGALVGDGAGAIVVEAVPNHGSIIDAIERTSTSEFDFIKMGSAQSSGTREYITFTRSHRIIHRAFSILPETAQELLDRNGLQAKDVTWTLTHQPGMTAIKKWHDALDIDAAQNLNTFRSYGNMSTANIPVNLHHFLTVDPKIKRGDIILAFTAGAGIHCAAVIFEY